ncbi:DUF1330 domain-containing protein [[Micrococcus luteus] ATCC 49442]|jgi:uncharacterized protein (DUF1330 family)|uniref:DUF1330 domain-containing protein n=1 Tax=[Micrococcus luteus] ATCC 49442 TaxID=2698727 RepID=UPI0013DC9702|nr:DUF1330 domain-containing protein [[Micrococcus luteus] ATCC 49442]
MSAYVVVALEVNEEEQFAEYVEKVADSFGLYSVDVLASSSELEVIEGVAPSERIVILRFESPERARSWYSSPEYQRALPLRHAAADTKFMVTVKGLALA